MNVGEACEGREATMSEASQQAAVRGAQASDAKTAEPAGGGAPAEAPASGMRRAVLRVLTLQETAPAAALVVLVLVIGLSHPQFFSSLSIEASIEVAGLTAITALGAVFLLAMGEIDISVGGTYGICFLVCAKLGLHGMSMYLAAVIAILLGAGLGLVNGVLVWLVKAPTIIITLGTYSLYAGLVQVISGGNQVGQGLPIDTSFFTTLGGTWFGIPVVGWIAVALCVVLTIVLNKSRPGAMIRAAGSNRSAAEFSGIPVNRLRLYCLMLTGALAGLAGVLNLTYAQGGDSSVGTGYELQVVAAAIIGGTAITGGTGSVPGGLIGALLVATINSGLVFFNINPLWHNVVTGAVILLAVGGTALLAHRRAEQLARLEA
jgi:ribose transport system permease protein